MIQHPNLLTLACVATLSLVACNKGDDAPAPAQTPKTKQATRHTPAQAPAGVKTAQTKTPDAKGPEDANATLHDAVPEDTVLWIELASFDALASAINDSIGESMAGSGSPTDPEQGLALLQMMGMPVDKLMRDKPIAMALSLELGVMEPKFSMIVPMRDTKKTAAAIADMSPEARAQAFGEYVVISNRSNMRTDSAAAQIFTSTRGDGLFGMRVDVARLMSRYGPQLEQGMESMTKGLRSKNRGREGYSEGVELASNFMLSLAQGLKTLSVRVDMSEGQLLLESATEILPGSKLSHLGSDDSESIRDLLRFVNLGQDEVILGTMRKEAIQFFGDPLAKLVGELAPSHSRKEVSTLYQRSLDMISGPAVGFAMGAADEDITAFLTGVDSQELMPVLESGIERMLANMDDFALQPAQKGQDDSSRFAQYDLRANDGTPAKTRLQDATGEAHLQLRLLGTGDQTMIAAAEGGRFQNRANSTPATIPTDLEWALKKAEGTNPALVSYTRLAGGASERIAMRALQGLPVKENKGLQNVWVASYIAMGATEWRAGMKVDLKAFQERLQDTIESMPLMAQPR